jgi:chemotaxis protein methyltransferase CheR
MSVRSTDRKPQPDSEFLRDSGGIRPAEDEAGMPPNPVSPMSSREFQMIAQLARSTFGVDLTEAKKVMVWSRLIREVRRRNCRSFSEYYRRVIEDETGEALSTLVDALTTSFTEFLREPAHFDFLRRTVVPQLLQRQGFRIWSAGTSTGEEAYSVAISLLQEQVPPGAISIVASDISRRALVAAARGVYALEKTQVFERATLGRYFLKGVGASQGWCRVKPEVRQLVTFRRINLMERLPAVGQFSVIFCRNVMIYFDRETQTETVRRLADCLEPGGYLMIGHSESLAAVDCPLGYVAPAIYRKLPLPGKATLGKQGERRRVR